MKSDTAIMWGEVKEAQKQHRRSCLEEAAATEHLVDAVCKSLRLHLSKPAQAHWVIRDQWGKTVIQYWPSARKIQMCKTGRIRKGVDNEKLCEVLQRGHYK